MSEIVGYTIVTHHADKTTQTTKLSAAQVAALASVAGRGSKTNEYVNSDECPDHGPWRAVPSGISKDGREYPAFWSCDVEKGEPRCRYRPHKDWVETHPPERSSSFDDVPF